MALPALGLVAQFIARKGVTDAAKKYGPKAVKKAQEQIAKREAAINNKLLGKQPSPTKGSKSRSAETNKVKARNKRLEEEMKGRERFDIDGDPLDEIPLRFDMSAGGLLSDDRAMYKDGGPGIEALRKEAPEVVERMGYSIGGAILKVAKKFKNKAQTKTNKIVDESEKQMKLDNLDAFDYEEAASMFKDGDMTLAKVNQTLKAAGYPTKDVEDFVFILSDTKGKSPSSLLKDRKDIIKKQESKKNPDGMTDAELEKEYERLSEEFAVDNSRFEMQKGGLLEEDKYEMNTGGMLSDDDMEDNYTSFIVEEALTEEEEDMLMNKLKQDEQLAMLFDKVVDVAQEFAGSGPVEGPGSGVSDSIPARLSDGEFVFTAKAVAEIGEDTLMSMMKDAEANADERQGFAMGGMNRLEDEIQDEESDVSDDMRRVNPRLNPNVR
jgi:hypothetical protein